MSPELLINIVGGLIAGLLVIFIAFVINYVIRRFMKSYRERDAVKRMRQAFDDAFEGVSDDEPILNNDLHEDSETLYIDINKEDLDDSQDQLRRG